MIRKNEHTGNTDSEKRCIALARTFLYNYGQGVTSPTDMYFDCCHLLSIPTKLQSSVPEFKILPAFSFFSKRHLTYAHAQFCLFDPERHEGISFLCLPTAAKLNWLYWMHSMQVLMFNFSAEELSRVEDILTTWNRPAYEYTRPASFGRVVPSKQYDESTISARDVGIGVYDSRKL